LAKTAFSDEWDFVRPGEVALMVTVSVETVLMDNGGLAVLTQVVDGPSHLARVEAGTDVPRKLQVLYHPDILRKVGTAFLDAADAQTRLVNTGRPN
jgi:hypothetical protein